MLLVCAVGSRYSDDPRVKADDTDKESKTRHLNGWKWFIQVHRVHMSLLRPPNLCDLQKCAVSVTFIQREKCYLLRLTAVCVLCARMRCATRFLDIGRDRYSHGPGPWCT